MTQSTTDNMASTQLTKAKFDKSWKTNHNIH